jgi:hypothetical protein
MLPLQVKEGTGTACNTSSKWVIAVQRLMSNFSGITMAKTSYIRQNGNDVHFELDQQAYMISWTFIVLKCTWIVTLLMYIWLSELHVMCSK